MKKKTTEKPSGSDRMDALVMQNEKLTKAIRKAIADFDCLSFGYDGDCGSGKIFDQLEEAISQDA